MYHWQFPVGEKKPLVVRSEFTTPICHLKNPAGGVLKYIPISTYALDGSRRTLVKGGGISEMRIGEEVHLYVRIVSHSCPNARWAKARKEDLALGIGNPSLGFSTLCRDLLHRQGKASVALDIGTRVA